MSLVVHLEEVLTTLVALREIVKVFNLVGDGSPSSDANTRNQKDKGEEPVYESHYKAA
jgi:hypothetical protein